MITRNTKKAASSTPRATPSKRLCENCKSLISSDNLVHLTKLKEDIEKFDKTLSELGGRAEYACKSLEVIKTESFRKLELLQTSIESKFINDMEKRLKRYKIPGILMIIVRLFRLLHTVAITRIAV